MPQRHHSALERYLERNRIADAPRRADDAVELVLDGIHRVYCQPAPQGAMVFETRLCSLPEDTAAAAEMMERTLEYAAVRLDMGAEGPVLSEDQRGLMLQQHLASDAGLEQFEQSLEDFTNAIGGWRRHLGLL
jgi:hypothetical protein